MSFTRSFEEAMDLLNRAELDYINEIAEKDSQIEDLENTIGQMAEEIESLERKIRELEEGYYEG